MHPRPNYPQQPPYHMPQPMPHQPYGQPPYPPQQYPVPPQPAPPPPTPPAISPLERTRRTLLHAAGVWVIMLPAAPFLAQLELPAQLLRFASPFGFVPWSLSLAAALNGDRVVLAVVLALATLYGYPDNLFALLGAVGTGAIIGMLVRGLLLKAGTLHG